MHKMKCPLTKEDCSEDCPWWVKLKTGEAQQGKCAVAWIPILLIELRITIDQIKEKKQ